MADTRWLPRPLAHEWEWQLDAACAGLDDAVFFHPSGERGPARSSRVARAKEVCAGCPVIEQCREHALAAREPYGIWGGLSEEERAEILRARDEADAARREPSRLAS